jgi:hypothetical protein
MLSIVIETISLVAHVGVGFVVGCLAGAIVAVTLWDQPWTPWALGALGAWLGYVTYRLTEANEDADLEARASIIRMGSRKDERQ